MKHLFIILTLFAFINNQFSACASRNAKKINSDTYIKKRVIPGAEQISALLPIITNKRIALLVNQTSMVGKVHLVDTLKSLKVDIRKIFSPEHGFRGIADAGETINNETDSGTGIPIVSLYGTKKKPSIEALKDVDVVIFDIQDVGVRFFTYISTMHYLMEACAANNKILIILDRPNPNGFYIDGPVLDMKNKSFVGMHPIPIVHGLTIGELAGMINGEKWLDSGRTCSIQVVKNKNYNHHTRTSVIIKPSPNLPNDLSIKLYPSLGLFEGTSVSMGRGTEFPFQVLGGPDKKWGDFVFTPRSIEGMSKNPPYEGIECFGIDLRNGRVAEQFTLSYLIDFYKKAEDKNKFFNAFFIKLAGIDTLKDQIIAGWKEEKIKDSWKKELDAYKLKRKKYLLYEDF